MPRPIHCRHNSWQFQSSNLGQEPHAKTVVGPRFRLSGNVPHASADVTLAAQ